MLRTGEAANGRNERCRDRAVVKRGPVEFQVPLVVLHIVGPALEAAVSLREVRGEQLLDETAGAAIEVPREDEVTGENFLVNPHRVVINKRRLAGEHLIVKDPKRPPVDPLVVALVEEHLGRDVLGGTAERVGLELHLLREAKVGDFEVTFAIKQQVLRLQITVDDLVEVEVLKYQRDLRSVELRRVVVEPPCLPQVREELPARDVLQRQVEEPAKCVAKKAARALCV